MNTSRIAAWLCALLVAGCGLPAAAEEPDCVVVFSQGRTRSETNPEANAMWNKLNEAFGKDVVDEFDRGGPRAIGMPYPMEVEDMDRITHELVQRATREKCSLLAQVGMYAEQDTQSFVTFMSVRRLEFTRMSGGTKVRIGAEVFQRVQRDPLSRETLDRLSASEVAHGFVASYRSQAGK